MINLKYKKMILGATCGVLVIGLCALALSKKEDAVTGTVEPTTQVMVSPTVEPTPNPILTATLEKNTNEEITTLVTTYLNASVAADLDTLKTVLSEAEQVTKEELQRWYEYVEEIQNIECYTLPGLDEDSYIVYVYYDMKIVDIDTHAPGLIQLYVCKAENDNYVILINQVDETIQEARNEALERKDVKELIATVNTKLNEAVTKDEKLKAFVSTLNSSAEQVQEQSSAPAATEEAPAADKTTAPATTNTPAATKAPVATTAPAATQAPAAN